MTVCANPECADELTPFEAGLGAGLCSLCLRRGGYLGGVEGARKQSLTSSRPGPGSEKFVSGNGYSALPERISSSGGEGLPFAPLADVIADAPPDPEWTWDGYLAPGALTLLAGRPKVGKSTMLFALLQAIGDGVPFLDRPTRATGCLLLTEERPATLAEKHRRFSLNGKVHALPRHIAGENSWPDTIRQAVGYCKQHNLGLLVVDVLDKWAPLGRDDENSAGATVEALLPLLQAAGQRLAVLIVTHQRKSGGQYGEAVRGSNALTGTVDVIVELERLPGQSADGSRVLRSVSRFAGTPDEVVAVLEGDTYTYAGDTAAARAAGDRAAILDALDPETAMTAAEVAEAAGLAERDARRHLDQMLLEGVACRAGRGVKGDPYSFRQAHFPNAGNEFGHLREAA
jgi:hypothetical protein